MKKLFNWLDDYVLECDWKDMALIKTCVCAFGIMLGLSLPKEKKKPAMVVSGLLFIATSAMLAVRFLEQFCPFCNCESEETQDHSEDEDGFIMRIVEEE